MMQRRTLIACGGAAMLAPVSVFADSLVLTSDLPEGTKEIARLANLPGKARLMQLTDRPPNYATPTDVFVDGVTPNDRFFVRYHMDAVPPPPSIDDWTLSTGGDAAGREVKLRWSDLLDLPAIDIVAVCQCAGNRRGLTVPHVAGVQWGDGAMGCAEWHGPRLSDVLKAARIKPEAVEIRVGGADTPPLPAMPPFRKSIPIAKALDDDTIIAIAMNGAPLPLLNGYPARLVVPGWTGTYWMKHLSSIEISATPLANFWMKTAYRVPTGLFPVQQPFMSQAAETSVPITEMVVNSLIADPVEGAEAEHAGFKIHGVAWDRGTGIKRVEVSLDGGKSWLDALLDRPLGPFAFRRFSLDTGFLSRGQYRLASRATSNAGERQAEVLKANPGGYHNNVPRVISVTVT
jgi:DMSO/TMAO reductase YedYZ molybdopterin-dependent catalytic subunit